MIGNAGILSTKYSAYLNAPPLAKAAYRHVIAGFFATLSYFMRTRVGMVGIAQSTPPLPRNREPGHVPGFFVPTNFSFDVRFTAESGRSIGPEFACLSDRYWQKRKLGGHMADPSYFKRMRVRAVGTVQITPPLPGKEGRALKPGKTWTSAFSFSLTPAAK